jgi:poly(A) polymerase
MIGDPKARYHEDPVRMLRAIRFAAKLNFDLDAPTAEPIDKLAYLLESISSARLFDETIKLLTGGNAVKTFELLRQSRVGDYLFAPTMNSISKGPNNSSRLLDLALVNTDSRLALGKSVTPAFLFAALLWPVLQNRLAPASPNGDIDYQRHQNAANDVILEQLPFTAVPKRFTIAAKEIWELQLRLARRNKRSIESSFAHPRFRAAYDFLLLREESGEDLGGLGQWWTDFQLADKEQRGELVLSAAKTPKRARRKPSRGKGEAG